MLSNFFNSATNTDIGQQRNVSKVKYGSYIDG